MKRRKIIIMILCVVMVFSTVTVSNTMCVEAKATKKALKYLKGTWHTWHYPGYKVKFTSKYVKYYYDDDGNYNTLPKNKLGKFAFQSKIVYTKKKSYGWLIKVKGSGGTYYFRNEKGQSKKQLYYYGNPTDVSTHSGSSSLEKIRKK